MNTNLAVLAVAALLALGTGGVVAAMDAPTTDTASDDVLPANYTVDVINQDGVSDEAVDQAIETAWANDTVQSYFDEGAGVHFEVWASGLDEDVIHVDVAPIGEPDETRVVTDVDSSTQRVTAVSEPVKLNASDAVTIDCSDDDTDVDSGTEDTSSEENATRLTADQAIQGQIDESSIERGDDGTLTFEVDSMK
jgi:hypothetical protein